MQSGHKRPKRIEHKHDRDAGETAREPTDETNNVATTASLEAWILELATALDIDSTAIDRRLVLDVSRSTHRVARAAAPFTIFLVGMAAGLNGGGAKAVSQAAATAQCLASKHTAQAE